ncbi:MAG: hypothetical protein ABI729_05930 [Chitinophagales bacterium]
MNIESEKKLVINEILNVKEEWVIKAIKRLLEIDESYNISKEHMTILEERISQYASHPDDVLDWDKIKEEM